MTEPEFLRARMLREPDDHGDFPERTQQAFLLACKPVGGVIGRV